MAQRTRNVIVASPASNRAKKYETAVTTWGDLKPVIAELLVGDVEAIVNPGNVTLNQDSAELPSGDFKVFLVPTKNKAGVSDSDARRLGTEIGNAIAEAANKASGAELKDLKERIIETIEDFFDVTLSDDCPECEEALQEAKKFVAR